MAAPGWAILEFPPFALGGPVRLPAASWTGRLAPVVDWLVRAIGADTAKVGLPVYVIHP